MVQRCSNGLPFVVLIAEAALRTGIHVEVYDGDNPATLLDVVPDTFARQWHDPLNAPGSGSFKLHADNPALLRTPNLLDAGNIVRFKLDRITRFAFQVEKVNTVQAAADGDSARIVTVSGRGVLSVLESAVAYTQIDGNPVRGFPGITPGHLLGVLFDEAQARSALAGVTRDWDDTDDSNNAPWAETLDQTERAGTDLLRIAERIAATAADVYMTPQLVLQVFNVRGTDRSVQTIDTAPIILRPGHNIEELSRDEASAIRNALLIETPAGFVERTDGDSIAAYGRREAFLSLGNVSESGAVDRAAEAVFERSADPAASIAIRITDEDDHRPYTNWNVGDWVLAPDRLGALTKYRVRAITVTETKEGTPVFVPELATITDELENRLEKWLSAMSRGTLGGVAGDIAEPLQVSAEAGTATTTAVDDGVSTHLATTTHATELDDLTDVDTTTDPPADGEILEWDAGAGAWVPVPQPAGDLDGLTDVDTATTPPTDGQALIWDNAGGLWVPGDVAAGGGGGSAQWQTFTPTIKAGATSLAGTGWRCRYLQLGPVTFWEIYANFDTTGGSGVIEVTDLPAPLQAATSATQHVGSAKWYDEGVNYFALDVIAISSTAWRFKVYNDYLDWSRTVGTSPADSFIASGFVVASLDAEPVGGGGGVTEDDPIEANSHPSRASAAFVREFLAAEADDSIDIDPAATKLTKTKAAGALAIEHAGGDGTAYCRGVAWAHAPAGDFYVEACIEGLVAPGNYWHSGIFASDSVAHGAGTQLAVLRQWQSRNLEGVSRYTNYTSRNFAGSALISGYTDHVPNRAFVRLAYDTATNTWTGYWSADGVRWRAGSTTVLALTVTHVGILLLPWGNGSPSLFSVKYVAAFDGLPA